MSKKTQPAPAQEQPNVEPIESAASPLTDSASTDNGNPQEPSELSAGEPAEAAASASNSDLDPVQPAESATGEAGALAIPDTALQAAHAALDLTPPAPEKTTVRLLFALGNIPAGKAVIMPAEQAAVLIAQGDADDHPEAVQYALAQATAVELAD
jgi:hypothetical protein